MNRSSLLQQAGKLRPLHRTSAAVRNASSVMRRQLVSGSQEVQSAFSPSTALIPVVSMENIDQLRRFFPAGAPVVRLMQTPFEPPPAEAAHLAHMRDPCSTHVEVRLMPVHLALVFVCAA